MMEPRRRVRPRPWRAASDPSALAASTSPAAGGAVPSAAAGPAPGRDRGLLGINVRYFALRAVIFGVVLAVVLLLGASGVLAFMLALVISGLASYPLALRQRRAVIAAMENRRGGRR